MQVVGSAIGSKLEVASFEVSDNANVYINVYINVHFNL